MFVPIIEFFSFSRLFLRAFVLGVVVCVLSSHSQFLIAAELYEMNTSVRALGMGNAYSAIVQDADALFYNPAGLARVSGINWLVADPRIGVDSYDVITKINDLQESDTFADTVEEMYGEYVWVGGGGKSAFTMPYFGFAFYDSIDASIDIANPVYPNLDLSVVNDYGYALGTGFPLIPMIFHVGFGVKYIERTGARVPFGPSYVSNLNADAIMENVRDKGRGYGFDFGANLLIPGPISPILSFVWKDVGNTEFRTGSTTLTAPPTQESEMIVGAALDVDFKIITIRPALDFKYLNRSDVQLGKKINFGVELGLPMLDIRAGFSQGYYTAGAGLSLGLIRFDVATYGVELGAYPGQREDRRYAAQLTIELGFDPSMGFLGGGGGGSQASKKSFTGSSGSGSGGKGGSGGSRGGGGGGRRLKQRR